MNFNTKRVVSMLIASMMVLAAISVGALAAPTITDDSDLEDEDLVYIDATGDDVENLVFEFDTADPVDVTATDVAEDDEETDTELATYNEDDAEVTTDENEYTVEVSHVDLANSEDRSVGDHYEIEVEITDGTDTETIMIDGVLAADADGSAFLFDDSAGEDDLVGTLDVEDAAEGYFFGLGEEDFDTYDASKNVAHDGEDADLSTTFVFDGETADAFDDSAEDVDAGEPVLGMTVWVQGEPVPTYADESGDIHSDGDAYAVYDDSTSELDVELGDDRADAISTDVEVNNNDVLDQTSFNDVRTEYGLGDAFSLLLPF